LPSEEDDQLVLNMLDPEQEESDDFSLASKEEDSDDGHDSSSQLVDNEDSDNSSSSTAENEESRDNSLSQEAVLNQIQVLEKKKERSDAADKFETALSEAEGRDYHRVVDLDILIHSIKGGEPPLIGRGRKSEFKNPWDALKNTPISWRRSETWSESDQTGLEELQQKLEEVSGEYD
jgi:hypothetical protein